jgi:hypothetical protein
MSINTRSYLPFLNFATATAPFSATSSSYGRFLKYASMSARLSGVSSASKILRGRTPSLAVPFAYAGGADELHSLGLIPVADATAFRSSARLTGLTM